jgi:hypothetical protein
VRGFSLPRKEKFPARTIKLPADPHREFYYKTLKYIVYLPKTFGIWSQKRLAEGIKLKLSDIARAGGTRNAKCVKTQNK